MLTLLTTPLKFEISVRRLAIDTEKSMVNFNCCRKCPHTLPSSPSLNPTPAPKQKNRYATSRQFTK